MAHDTIRDPAVRETERRVLEAARAFAEAKTACRDAWVASGTVPPSLTNTLDKATDNLLSADSALRAVLDPPSRHPDHPMTRPVRPRQRWNDTERRFGPLTVARDLGGTRYFALVLNSGDEDHPGCTLRLSLFGRTLILDCPPILRPYREKVTARSWDAATIARMGRDWYYAEDPRQVGLTISEGGS